MADHSIPAPTSRFHNMSDAALADEIGRIDGISKAAEAELKALKDEFKARGLAEVAGGADLKALKDHLGTAYSRFEIAIVSTVIRIKPAIRTLPVAA